MKPIALFLAVSALHAASYYVSSTGNDSTGTGSPGAPWLTLAHAVGAVATGDTIIIVADGNRVTCDVPVLPATITNITIASSKLPMLRPVGYRVNPATDSANFGKCQFSGSGIITAGEVHGFITGGVYGVFQTFTLSGSTFTLPGGNPFSAYGLTLANGSQIYFDWYNELQNGTPPPSTIAVPSPLVRQTHYYVVNCSSSPACGSQNSTLQVSATPGGSPITITACDAACLGYGIIGLPIQADASADTITSTDPLGGVYANGTAIEFASGGVQVGGTLPAPLSQDVIYYVRDLSGRTFKIAATPGGAAIDITDAGTGMQSFTNGPLAHGWKFSGIEFAPTTGNFMSNLIVIGGGKEAGPAVMPSHFEFDRVWLHDFSEAQNGPTRGVAENSMYFSIHDSWCDGIKLNGNDSQCLWGSSSLGPTNISNNFFEGAGENMMYGGAMPNYYPLTNKNKIVTGNYFYKPFIWKHWNGAGAPSGTCLYDAPNSPDPDHRGGETYLDTMASQNYTCVAGTWTMVGSTPPYYTVKNLYEFKSGSYHTLTGNVFQGNWLQDQAGQALAFGQRADSGPGIANDHLIVQNNKFTNVYRFITWGSLCTDPGSPVLPCVNGVTNNHVIKNNLAILGGTPYCGVTFLASPCGQGMEMFAWSGRAALQDTIDHNTILAPDGITGSGYSPVVSFLYDTLTTPTLNNRMTYTNGIYSYDFYGTGQSQFLNYFINSLWNRMVMIGATGPFTGSVGATNSMSQTDEPANTAAVGFVNASAGDYHLSPTSPYSASCTSGCSFVSSDGTDVGADIDLVNMATSGAAAGTPPWNASLTVNAGSTQLVLRYQAPTTNACTATIYRAAARISANQVASVADSAASSISDILTRQLYISGLTASTHYWYKLVCAGSVIMVGDFFTRAPGTGTYTFSFDWSTATAMRYSSSASMSSPTSLGAATHQAIPVATNSVIYAQVGTAGPITILIAP